MTWLYAIGGIVGGIVVLFAGLVAWLRIGQARHVSMLKGAIREYAEAKGASVSFDANGFTVRGPRGEGYERMTSILIMCQPKDRHRWESTIGFVLRKYIPDAFDEAFEKAARERLSKLGPEIARLDADELRARLRVKIFSTRTSSEGLATCARPLGERFEARVVLDGFDLSGIPKHARAKLVESDADLFGRALDATLPVTPPSIDDGAAPTNVWLCRSEAIFGATPCVIVGAGPGLRWMRATPHAEPEIVELCRASLADGPMKAVMWAWDGHSLSGETIMVHTVMGPTTPDFTLTLPPSLLTALGVVGAVDGRFGVRRQRA